MKNVVPIISGNAQYLGLTTNEWILQVWILVIYMAFVSQLLGWLQFICAVLIHAFVLFILVTLFKNIEQNVFSVLLKSRRIGRVVIGSIERKIPIQQTIEIVQE